MSRVPDALPELHTPAPELGGQTAPSDSQTSGLQQRLRSVAPSDTADRDLHGFATADEIRGQMGDSEAATAQPASAAEADVEPQDDVARPPAVESGRLTIPAQLTNKADAGHDVGDAGIAPRTEHAPEHGVVRLGRAGVATEVESKDGSTVTAADEADGREVDVRFNERDDFDRQTDGSAPTDLVTAWMQDMRGDILDREKVVEKAKDVEAGLTAGWIVRINEAVDDPDPESLLTFRDEYIAAREENMRLTRQKPSKEFDGNEEFIMQEIDPIDHETGKPYAKNKRDELQTAQNKVRKHEIAVDEADKMIARALRYRQPVEPGKTELPEDMRHDLEAVDQQGKAAKSAMVGSIVRWATTQSMKSSGRAARVGMAQADVIQEGNLGAIRAVEKFDYTRGFTLSTYSTHWIDQHVLRALATDRAVKIPNHIAEKLAAINRKEGELLSQLKPGEELTDEMVAAAAKITVEELAELRLIDQPVLSLDRRMGDGNGDDMEYGEVVGDERTAALEADVAERLRQAELRRAVDEALGTIGDARIEDIIRRQFGLAEDSDGERKSTNQIGAELGITGERVRQLSRKGIARLQANQTAMGRLSLLR